jgi:acyl-CoA hydrolase
MAFLPFNRVALVLAREIVYASVTTKAKQFQGRTVQGQDERGRAEMRMPKGRTVAESAVEMVEVVLPNDANPLGNMLGGRVMHLMDMAGAIAAHRHSRSIVVTASVDNLAFLLPVRVGQLVILRGHVTRAFHTSMEAEVKVYLEDFITGERRQTSSAFLTYVALDHKGRPRKVPLLIPQTAEEKRRFREALARRRHRLALAARTERGSSESGIWTGRKRGRR